MSGRFRPSEWISATRWLGGAPSGSNRSTGLPESREMKKTITVRSQRTTIACRVRRIR